MSVKRATGTLSHQASPPRSLSPSPMRPPTPTRRYPAAEAYPASVRSIDVPFVRLMLFFLKAVFAAIPAMIVLIGLLWLGGQALEAAFPELLKAKILITFPNS